MSEILNAKISEWLEWDKNEETRAEIERFKEADNINQLQRILLSRLQFGTAGLRGKMGAGYSQMNDLVIIQTAQGLCMYVEETFQEIATKYGIVIGYDGRHHSKRFAQLTASIFLNHGIPVQFFSQLCPTPFVAYALRYFKCVCGVMVTASHNPKDDNGFKVYWQNGAQIISPHDKNIQNMILKNLVPWEKSWDIIQSSPILKDPLRYTENAYYGFMKENTLFPEINREGTITFTYTPMHGVGQQYMKKAFEAVELKPFATVSAQCDPDPDFPTVKYPNPEEGRKALTHAFNTADTHDSTIVLANDPDADRLAVAEKNEHGDWHVFTGNELGALLGWWCLFSFRQRDQTTPLSDLCMLSSTVSSKIIGTMAATEGLTFVETLTGFKWMGNKAYELILEGKKVLFAFEEAIGYMCGSEVLDKDGISAAVCIAQLAVYLEKNSTTLRNKLDEIYMRYGQHMCLSAYYICYEPDVIQHIFERLSNFRGKPNNYPDNLGHGKYRIVGVRDLRSGYDSSEPDNRAKLPTSSSSYMVTFTFHNGLTTTIRTSGTEPKIKYYLELRSSPKEKDMNKLKRTLTNMLRAIIEELLQPQKNGLIPPE